jgi:ppGpp synthetase/RelA/SpoT-type nucleotidyltranferase
MTLRTRAKKVAQGAIIAQRLKRLKSIAAKLSDERNMHMKLSQMQDIGGCRAVLPTVRDVEKLAAIYEVSKAKNPSSRSKFVKKYDYILEPKEDGYRGIHFVYKYHTTSKNLEIFNGLRIEIQLRSQLQHAWATAVEIVSTFTGQALKSNIGSEEWKRFFALMGSAIALRERMPLVPDTPTDETVLVAELRDYAMALKVEEVLEGSGIALRHTEVRGEKNAKAFLLVLNSNEHTVTVNGFSDLEKASEEYIAIEKSISNMAGCQAVLVSVESLAALRSAYPNYYLDTTAFVLALKRAIKPKLGRRSVPMIPSTDLP